MEIKEIQNDVWGKIETAIDKNQISDSWKYSRRKKKINHLCNTCPCKKGQLEIIFRQINNRILRCKIL